MTPDLPHRRPSVDSLKTVRPVHRSGVEVDVKVLQRSLCRWLPCTVQSLHRDWAIAGFGRMKGSAWWRTNRLFLVSSHQSRTSSSQSKVPARWKRHEVSSPKSGGAAPRWRRPSLSSQAATRSPFLLQTGSSSWRQRGASWRISLPTRFGNSRRSMRLTRKSAEVSFHTEMVQKSRWITQGEGSTDHSRLPRPTRPCWTGGLDFTRRLPLSPRRLLRMSLNALRAASPCMWTTYSERETSSALQRSPIFGTTTPVLLLPEFPPGPGQLRVLGRCLDQTARGRIPLQPQGVSPQDQAHHH